MLGVYFLLIPHLLNLSAKVIRVDHTVGMRIPRNVLMIGDFITGETNNDGQ
ncbi:hypothetical protein BDV32DRAFT_61747 [Aspergillus pseudonomiae]|nr:hypothetical protein BDV32DRAFT_61747 [Aspergillus pseudonomiae]